MIQLHSERKNPASHTTRAGGLDKEALWPIFREQETVTTLNKGEKKGINEFSSNPVFTVDHDDRFVSWTTHSLRATQRRE